MKSPLVILLELLVGLIASAVNTIIFIFTKLVELSVSLGFLAGSSLLGMIIAAAAVFAVLLFVLRFIFSASKQIIILVAITALVLILIFVSFAFV